MAPVKKPKASQPLKSVAVKQPGKVISGQLEKKIRNKKLKSQKVERGVVLVKHLPHGFFEEQLKKYFQQFGRVTRLRLARSTRTGGSRGFAFVEFEYPEVAKVAAETMDNYLMFKKVVKAAYIPPAEQKFNYFKSTVRKVKNKVGKEIYVSGKTASIQRRVQEQNDWTDEQYQKRTDASLKKLKQVQKKFAHLDFDFNNVVMGCTAGTSKANQKQPKVVKNKDKSEKTSEKKNKKSAQEIQLEDLLGNTLNEDTDDEDYSDAAISDGSEESDIDGMDSDEPSDLSDDNDEQEEVIKPKTSKKRNADVDRYEQLIKKKPKTGGIQKATHKVEKKQAQNKAAKSLKLSAAKELAKPFKVHQKNGKISATKGKKVKK